ncbi:MAG: diguanylate cyclase [Arcobacteraceae bacterium]|nr:diguanylate cyclase [Arcobacteraceae bacterium]
MTKEEIELLKSIQVLYVEDELDIQKITADVLSSVCKKVVCANNGVEALELFDADGDFDIIVTDINMPKMDGITLIKKIRERDNTFPITITTAHTEVHFLQESIDLGVNGYTLKPIDLKKLMKTVAKVSEGRVLRKKLEIFNSELIQKVKEQTFELHSILDSQESLIAVSNIDGIHTINKRFLDFLGLNSLDDLKKEIGSICNIFIKEDGYYFSENLNDMCCLANIDHTTNSDIFVKMKNFAGIISIFKLNVNIYEYNGTHFILSLSDITSLKSESDLLQYQANHDSLTQIYNRQYFNSFIKTEISRSLRYSHLFSIAMFDIDHFKNVNDTYGHDIGDEVLKNISTIVKTYLRDTDILARWGGEEFMILLAETPISEAFTKIEQLRKHIEASTLAPNLKEPVTVSFGVTEFMISDTKAELLKRVDIALYQAKNSGRNQVVKI